MRVQFKTYQDTSDPLPTYAQLKPGDVFGFVGRPKDVYMKVNDYHGDVAINVFNGARCLPMSEAPIVYYQNAVIFPEGK